MKLGKTLYLTDRKKWRAWLEKNRKKKKEIWLIYYKKSSGKPRIPYNDAVEEALCFGWIDSTAKKIDEESFAQRFTPRNPKSLLSEMNRERIRRLIKRKKMTQAGLEAVKHAFDGNTKREKIVIAPDILNALKKDRKTWKNFRNFSESYRRIRIGWIEGARERPEMFKTRLNYFVKKTAKNKKFGMVQ
ncbi:MAG: YdeI/OmpD-associated family protein [Candidatus Diapherotrites archaeon]